MAIFEFLDGFDHYSNNTYAVLKWNSGVGDMAVWNTGARFTYGGMANPDNDGNNGMRRNISAQTTRTIGFWLRIDGGLGGGAICKLLDAGTNQVELRVNGSGNLLITRNGTTVDTSSSVIAGAVGYLIEWTTTIGSSGTYLVKVSGGAYTTPTTFLSGTGNIQNTVNNTANQVQINGGLGFSNTWFDDFYVRNDATMLNDWRIFTDMPNADGATTAWTPSTGTNHSANVDDSSPNGDTDYNASATVGQIDLYAFPSLSATGTIVAVQNTLTARKDDAGARQIAEQCRSGGTNYTGANTFTMSTSYGMFLEIRETDPATSAAWTVSGVNSAQFGVTVVS